MSLAIAAALVVGLLATFGSSPTESAPQKRAAPTPEGSHELVVGGGCFWCVEAVFERLKGVHSVENGYAGGPKPNPTYREVTTGTTGHAEVVKIVYDPNVVSRDDLLRVFFTTHDPTTLNRQGGDVGTQYRSVVFYTTDEEKLAAQKVMDEITAEKLYPSPIVTTLEPLVNYTRAEEYHQDYFEKYEKASPAERATMNSGYCSAVIAPKVAKFRLKYADKLRKD
jgi:methionine-S-sulfoxide reductase